MFELFYIYRFYFRQVVMIWEGYKLIKNMIWSTHRSEQKTLIEYTNFLKVSSCNQCVLATFKQRIIFLIIIII